MVAGICDAGGTPVGMPINLTPKIVLWHPPGHALALCIVCGQLFRGGRGADTVCRPAARALSRLWSGDAVCGHLLGELVLSLVGFDYSWPGVAHSPPVAFVPGGGEGSPERLGRMCGRKMTSSSPRLAAPIRKSSCHAQCAALDRCKGHWRLAQLPTIGSECVPSAVGGVGGLRVSWRNRLAGYPGIVQFGDGGCLFIDLVCCPCFVSGQFACLLARVRRILVSIGKPMFSNCCVQQQICSVRRFRPDFGHLLAGFGAKLARFELVQIMPNSADSCLTSGMCWPGFDQLCEIFWASLGSFVSPDALNKCPTMANLFGAAPLGASSERLWDY